VSDAIDDKTLADMSVDDTTITDMSIMIIDDDQRRAELLERILARAGHRRVIRATNPDDAVEQCTAINPDLVLLELHMSGCNGLEVLDRLRPMINHGGFLPVVVTTVVSDPRARRCALEHGASDFLCKPLDPVETVLRVRHLLFTRARQSALATEKRRLEATIDDSKRQMAQTRTEIIRRLAIAAEHRDDDTGQHTTRVGWSSAAMAHALGMSDDEVSLMRLAAPLHDVGKIGVPDSVLLKPGRLSRDEWEVMKTHTTIGAAILSNSQIPELRYAEVIALTHHEHWDGNGYPRGLAGAEIPLIGRIVAVADVFDALVQLRPYKPPWTVEAAAHEIRNLTGCQFDPEVVGAFERLDHHELAGEHTLLALT
jgi:putative two-component system response regulator